MRKNMNRRKFLTISGLSVAAVAIPVVGFSIKSLHSAVSNIIYKEYNYLTLNPEGVDLYVQEYLNNNKGGHTYHMKIMAFDLFNVEQENSTIISHIVQNYILSTDFFLNKMDETKVVNYIGAYDPYHTPCANPFTNTYYPSI
jgi:hypothetical protein